MINIKKEAFKNINEYLKNKSPRVFIYTMSLTAGISIEIEHFDKIYAIYSSSKYTSDIYSFI